MASNISPSCSKTLSKSCSSVLVSNDLMQLIKEDRNKEDPQISIAHLTTLDEVLMHVKNYIVKHQLYDRKNPSKILVGGNELGSLFGKSEISIRDVRDILFEKFVFPVTAKQNSSEVTGTINDKKRKLEDDSSEFSAKMTKNDGCCDSEESVYSFQDYDTEYVKDSSDDNFSNVNGLIIAETIDVDVEYEIESNSECSYESDDDFQEFLQTAVIHFISEAVDSDIEYLADRSSDDESEKELSEEDKWLCDCGMLNSPVMRRCCACWETMKDGWRSGGQKNGDAPRKRRRNGSSRSKRKLLKSVRNKDLLNRKLPDFPIATTESLNSPSTSCNDSSDATLSQSSFNSFDADKTTRDKQLCSFCCEKPADSSIVHGKTACRVCCYKCGRKLYAANKRCPYCRRTIERIVYLYHL